MCAGHADGAQLASIDKRSHRGGGSEKHVNLAAQEIGHGRTSAAVRDVRRLDFCEVVEHLAREVRGGAGTLRGVGQLAWVCLCSGQYVLDGLERAGGVHHQHVGPAADQ
ncbi:hypothetical protein D9M68_922390 [compost metagenome]